MSGNASSSVYIGNLDERVTDRVLYDILIQAGRVVDLHIPKDKETDKPRGFAFAEYETQEIAEYAVKLFSGLVVLYNRTLKFAISGQDRPSQNLQNGPMSASNLSNNPRLYPLSVNSGGNSHQSMRFSSSSSCRVSAYPYNHSQVPVSPGVTHHHNGYGSQFNGYDNGRRVFDKTSRFRSRRNDSSHHTSYPY